MQAIHLPIEPNSYRQAALHPEWMSAMQCEFDALCTNRTWTLFPRPLHQKVVRNKWVFKVKQKQDGSVDRYKARLVAKGFDQTCGVDYYETFSPVVKPVSIRIILALAVHFDWHIRQLDVSNAFLHGVLDEEVYMDQPPGFIDSEHPDYVCRLHKSIYGLKQAPRAWFTRLSTALLELGFIGSQVDHSLFMCHSGSTHIFLLIYVDDIIVTSNHGASIDVLVAKLKSDFAMKDLVPFTISWVFKLSAPPLAFISASQNTILISFAVFRWMRPNRMVLPAFQAPRCLALMGNRWLIPLSFAMWLEPCNMPH